MEDLIKEYSNNDITIVWKPNLCIKSTLCWKGEKGLLSVFNPGVKPWINPEGAPTSEIIKRVNACPSGALSFYYISEAANNDETKTENIVEVITNGPLMVYGNIIIKDKSGSETKKNKITALCRCGASSNKPYCDGSHVEINFKD